MADDAANPAPTSQDVHRIITNRMRNGRPARWEDDISRNGLETEPFRNGEPPSTFSTAAVRGHPVWAEAADLDPGLGLDATLSRDTAPIPPSDDREGYRPGDDVAFWIKGLVDYLKVRAAIERHGVTARSILDFGCASGRVLRHYAFQGEYDVVWGSDLNHRHVRWLAEHMPGHVRPIGNHALPALPLRDASVDVLTAFSVFTHIDVFELHWLAELARVLRDGGLAYVTVHDESTWDMLNTDHPLAGRQRQRLKDADADLANRVGGPLPPGRSVARFTERGPYRAQAFHSSSYIEQVWGRYFEIAEVLPLHHNLQTVLCLRPR